MGVTGLWRLIEPAGKPVPVETLENKVLAVDISIWLHQMVKGYQDAKGAPLPNAHLIGLFQRLCKLLYFRIKPVFVFDGGFPDLKKETIAKRQDNKSKYNSQSEKLKREIALLLGKKTAIGALLGKQISPKKNKPVDNNDDIFKLPALPAPESESESEFESEDEHSTSASSIDLHTLDLESDKFKNLPLKEKYDLLVEAKETRKMNSWGKMHTLPKKSDNFSDFQMQRLLKRRKVQECLEETEKEMGDGCMSLNELESLLNEEGIDTNVESLPSRRIASDNTTRYLLINNVKQALEDAKKREIEAKQKELNENTNAASTTTVTNKSPKHDELEDDLQKAIKMSLECVDDPDTSACTSKADDSWTSNLTDTDYSEDDDGFEQPDMSSAKAYIMQYSDFTPRAIDSLVISKCKGKDKGKESNVNKIIEELNEENTIIEDRIELTSDNEINQEKNINIKSENNVVIECGPENITLKECNKKEVDINDTETSVIGVEDPPNEVICLDTSIEEASELNTKIGKRETPKSVTEESTKESSSSADEFEEVSDSDQPKKSFIELTLNMGTKVENDIFADIFDVEDKKDAPIPESAESLIKGEADIDTNKKHEDTLSHTELREKVELNTRVVHEKEISDSKTVKNIESKETNCSDKSSNEGIVKERNSNETVQDNTSQNETINLKEKNENIVEKSKIPEKEPISRETLNTIVSEIEVEEKSLFQEKGRLDRIGRNITEEMTKEAQELLQVFGIPYIIAPMEAEAQCAFLESIKLTDGTITDDSDIWLFGGRTVYKNFFNQKKHVLQFLSERIERSFNLTREQLVLLALLVGSDYTTGVQGVGPVTALEILASFPFNKRKINTELAKNPNKQVLYQELIVGLQEFKKWVKAGKRTDNINLKKKLKNVSLTDDFPSVRVVQAYLEPNIERSEEKFTWGEIDITILRDYTKSKFGWSQNKLDEIIKPVLKRMGNRKNQKSVYDYFKKKVEFQSLEDQMSKRVKAAVQKMGPEIPLEEIAETAEAPKTKKKRIVKSNTNDSNKAGPSKPKRSKNEELKEIGHIVKTSAVKSIESTLDIKIPKSDRVQEIIPQREKDKQHLLENKLKAIEVFRKTKIDRKKKTTKRKLPVTKEKAELSETDSD